MRPAPARAASKLGQRDAARAPRRDAVRAQRLRLPPRHVPRARRRDRDLSRPRTRERRCASSSSTTRSRRSRCSIRSPAQLLQRVPRFTVYPASHYVTPRDTVLRAIEAIKAELRERLELLPGAGQAARGAAARAAHALRPRDAERDGLLPGHRELLAPPLGPRAGRAAAHADRLFSRRMPAGHRREPRHRAADRRHVHAATARARRRWSTTASACPPRSTTGRSTSRSSSARCARRSSCPPRPPTTSARTPRKSSSRWCGPPGWSTRR